jgi:hypothetical protein
MQSLYFSLMYFFNHPYMKIAHQYSKTQFAIGGVIGGINLIHRRCAVHYRWEYSMIHHLYINIHNNPHILDMIHKIWDNLHDNTDNTYLSKNTDNTY